MTGFDVLRLATAPCVATAPHRTGTDSVFACARCGHHRVVNRTPASRARALVIALATSFACRRDRAAQPSPAPAPVAPAASPIAQPAAPPRITSLAASGGLDARVFASLDDGTVWQWSRAANDQPWRPARVALPDLAAEVVAGDEFACARLRSGAVWCWGRDAMGALGRGTHTSSVMAPAAVSGVAGARSIAAGAQIVCAVDGAGAVLCWGAVASPQGAELSLAPRAMPGLTGVVSVRVGAHAVYAIRGDGAVHRWTTAPQGEAWSVEGPEAVASLQGARALTVCGEYGCAINPGGATLCWGWGSDPQPVEGIAGVEALACGESISYNENSAGSEWTNGHGEACARIGVSLRCWTHEGTELERGVTTHAVDEATATLAGASLVYAAGDRLDGFLCAWTPTEAKCGDASIALPTAADRAAPPATIGSPAASAPSPTGACRVRARASFHLRAADVMASEGGEFPTGTEVQVTGPGAQQRRTMRSYRVKVLAGGAEGFMFLAPGEVPAGCGG